MMILLRYPSTPRCEPCRRDGSAGTGIRSNEHRATLFVAFAVVLAFSLGEAACARDGWAGSLSAGPDQRIARCSNVVAWIGKVPRRNKIAGYVHRGGACHLKQDYDGAIEDFCKALSFDPEQASILTARASTYRGKGDFDRALANYPVAVAAQAKNALVFYGQGGVYRAKGDLDHTIEDFTEALRLDPEPVEKALRVDPQLTSARKELEDSEKSSAGVSEAAPIEELTKPSHAGSPITAISVSLAMARLVQFLAAMILLGASLFPVYALPPAAPADMMQVGKMVPRSVVIAAFAAVLSALAWAAASITLIAGDVDGLFDAETLSQYFFETSFGKVWLFRIVVAIALLLVVVLSRRHLFARNGSTALVALLAAALLASQAWIGHPASLPAPQRWFVTAAYVLHVFAAATWLGALLPLGLLVKRALHEGTPPQLAEFALRRFSPVGMAAVGIILLGGLINAISRAVSFEAFVTSIWGRIIILKFAIVSTMIAVAALNRFVLTPLLPGRAEIALPKLARNIAIEQAAGLLVLAASAFLAVFHPPGMTGMTH